MKLKIKNLKLKRKGVAALAIMLSIGTLIFIISLSTTALTFWSVQNIKNSLSGLKTYYAAYSGLQDALIKLERNKDFSDSFYLSVNGDNDVLVSISNVGNQVTITSTAVIGQISKKLETVTDIDSNTGLITPSYTTELTL